MSMENYYHFPRNVQKKTMYGAKVKINMNTHSAVPKCTATKIFM